MAAYAHKTTTFEEVNPFRDLSSTFAQLKMPGLDMSLFVEARRKDVEALVAANKLAYEAVLALARTQTDLLTQAMLGMQESAKAMMAGGMSAAETTRQTEAAQKAWEKMVADMKQVAEAVRKAQVVAMAGLTERAAENMKPLTELLQVR